MRVLCVCVLVLQPLYFSTLIDVVCFITAKKVTIKITYQILMFVFDQAVPF